MSCLEKDSKLLINCFNLKVAIMRKLTKKEEAVCLALQKHHAKTPPVLVGEVLRELFNFKCIRKNSLGVPADYPYKCSLTVEEGRRDEVVKNLNEAIALIRLLEEKGMLYLSSNGIDKPIGQTESLARLTSEPIVTVSSMRDHVCDNSWRLLNSYYYLTNGFDDYVKNGFKTVEARRHRQMIIVAGISILVAIGISVFTTCWNSNHNQIKLESKQYEQIIELLHQNDVQQSNQTTKIIEEIDKEIKSMTDSMVSVVKEKPAK